MQKTILIDGDKAPRHVAIIMDGNGRWAKLRGKPRVFGHSQGAKSLTTMVKCAVKYHIKHLTVFAFSSENWKRPQEEVSALMQLFALSLKKELKILIENNIKLVFIGDLTAFSSILQTQMQKAMQASKDNTGLVLTIAVNYGGRWDVINACKKIAMLAVEEKLDIDALDQVNFKNYLSKFEDVDLLIRTGGECRISNFLLYQAAYAELYFTNTLWPDFGEDELVKALNYYASRERRFGMISEQVRSHDGN